MLEGMGFNSSSMPWRDLEQQLSDSKGSKSFITAEPNSYEQNLSNKYISQKPILGRENQTSYAELHAHSYFSFLDGASSPEELASVAADIGLSALALTDHGGFYGVVRFAEAAKKVELPTVFGAELTVDSWQSTENSKLSSSRNGVTDPAGQHLVVLSRGPQGYSSLATLISKAQMNGTKGSPLLSSDELLAALDSNRDDWAILTGGRKGIVPTALASGGLTQASKKLDLLVDAAGRSNVFVELWDHGDPRDSSRNEALYQLATSSKVKSLCTNGVHYATPKRRYLAAAMAAVRSRRSLEEINGWLPSAGSAYLRSGDEQAQRFFRYPGVVAVADSLGKDCSFDLSLVAPSLPPYPCPDGLDEIAYLKELVEERSIRCYGRRSHERVVGAWAQVDHELGLIEQLGFAGYFLVVWDIVSFCRTRDIYCQGRGSAANSAVCYALRITNVDSVSLGLLFERFLSAERNGPPDIDLDIESDRREEVIQYIFERYGRSHTAQVANVITYRPRSAVRDMARALGYSTGQQDAWAKSLDRNSSLDLAAKNREPLSSKTTFVEVNDKRNNLSIKTQQNDGNENNYQIPIDVLRLASEIENSPRHLGIHSGGMVICDRPIVEVCPVEWGKMAKRSVLQWDKDDCAAVGLVKFDLLGLGMLSALHRSVDLIANSYGVDLDLSTLPQEDEVYEMLCTADSIGVFQVESRAQMATLPRLKPRCFYDLVVEIALIRPGPIQGGSVHPYIRRRNGTEAVTYLHPLLKKSSSKTLGVPLFQEQLMQMAIDVAGFSASEADQLRQAMGSKRSKERMKEIQQRLFVGMADHGISYEIGEQIWNKMSAFANYGFPESHSVSFANLVYSSSWIKLHYPAAFCASLVNSQPMGFYSPHSLVQDARRHGVVVRTPDVNASMDDAILELSPESHSGFGVRLGLSSVRGIGNSLALEIAEAGPYKNMEQLARRVSLDLKQLEALATAGAFTSLGLNRRDALWAAGAVAQSSSSRLQGIVTGVVAPTLPGMSEYEVSIADLWATGVAPEGHPTKFIRGNLNMLGIETSESLKTCAQGKVKVAGAVTHRQRPSTANGTLFINLEDETGLINVVVSKGCWLRFRSAARSAPALLVSGRLERHEGVVNVVAEKIEVLELAEGIRSRNFY